MGEATSTSELYRRRQQLVESVRRATDVPEDSRILDAFLAVPRHLFVDADQVDAAYQDRALLIGDGQTISQPSMIAIMLLALDPRPENRALEVGAGSGYAAALLGALVARVDAVEIIPALAQRARHNLERAGIRNVFVHTGDGSAGFAERAPFDKILVSAAAKSLPNILLEQLAPGGRMAVPVGSPASQFLMVADKSPTGEVTWRKSVGCLFVPLLEPERRRQQE